MLRKISDIVLAVVVLFPVVVAISAIMAFPVMLLWNGVLPHLFTSPIIKTIDFWTAWGLLILCGLLFKGLGNTSS